MGKSRILSALVALLALSCAPPERSLTSGERQALNRVSADIVGNWSCDEGSDEALLRRFSKGGSGTIEFLNYKYSKNKESKVREALLDVAIQVTWRIEQDRVYPVLVTEAGTLDVLVVKLEVDGRKLARDRQAVEIVKNSIAESYADKVFHTKILRLDETHLTVLSGTRRSYCVRSVSS